MKLAAGSCLARRGHGRFATTTTCAGFRRQPPASEHRPVERILAVVPDLFFATRIEAVARAAGADVSIVPPGQALERCLAEVPALVLVDLHADGDPLAMVRALRAEPRLRHVRVVGFYSHVEDERRRAALAAGFDEALPRSAFVGRLPGLLAPGASAPSTGGPS